MKNPVCYYWKEPTTGVEMNFTQDEDWGWCIGFPNGSPDFLLKQAGITIPWPELTEEEQKVVDENYRKLHENIRLSSEED